VDTPPHSLLPEARRQVVAQIIDYAKQVGRWDYSRLEEVFGQHAKDNTLDQQSLHEYLCEQTGEELDQVEFIDAVGRCLRNGRLLLLIVGDGIRESVEEMATYLQQTPNLQFTLGRVEVACYRVPEGKNKESLLLVPRIVTKTAEITRAVVRIQMTEEAAEKVVASTAIPPEKTPKGSGSSSPKMSSTSYSQSLPAVTWRQRPRTFSTRLCQNTIYCKSDSQPSGSA